MDVNALDRALIGEVWTLPDIYANLEALCDFGSRFSGTESERQARDFIHAKFEDYGLKNARLATFDYLGWTRGGAEIGRGSGGRTTTSSPWLRSDRKTSMSCFSSCSGTTPRSRI